METVNTIIVKDAFDTARLVAQCRAVASERPDGRIQDPYARLLADERGEELWQAMEGRELEMWAIVIRTSAYDEIILRLVKDGGIDTVINLAAGLDTRPYRLTLPPSLRWIEYDRPEVLAYKHEKLAEIKASCMVEHHPLNVTDHEATEAALSRATKGSTRTLVLTEGLLIYLPSATVVSLAKDLRAQSPIRCWLTEVPPNNVVEQHDALWNKMAGSDAQVRFAPSNGLAFFGECGWEIAEFRYIIREILRLKLPFQVRRSTKILAHLLPKKPVASFGGGGLALLKPVGSDTSVALARPSKSVAAVSWRVCRGVLHWLGFW